MYKSKEIRWFDKEENKIITKWFSDLGIKFSNINPRTDFYLQIPDRVDMSIKLREGNVEVKQRSGQPELFELTNSAKGYLENWVKWSFDVEANDSEATSIIKEKRYNWIEVYKERLGVKMTLKQDDSLKIHNIKEILPAGCQVEYTKLKIKNKEWFTFAVEWFGDSFFELNKLHLDAILGETAVRENNSFGYNEFLNNNQRHVNEDNR